MAELIPYLRLLGQRRWRLLVGSLLMLATVLSAIGLLSLSGWFITATGVTAMLWAMGLKVTFDIYVPGAGIRFFALTRTVSRYFERLYNHDTVLRLLADLRGGIFAALARLEPTTLMQLRAGMLLNRLTADIDALDNLYLRLLAPPVVALLSIVVVTTLLWIWLPTAGAVVLVAATSLLLLVTLTAAMQGLPLSRALVERTEQLRVRLIDQVQGMAELSAYGTLGAHAERIHAQDTTLLASQRRLARMTAGWNAAATLVIQATVAAVLGLALQSYLRGDIGLAVATLMPLAVMAMTEAFAGLPAAFNRLGSTCAAAERLTATVHHPEQRSATRAPVALSSVPPLAIQHVSFTYPQADKAVFGDLDMNIGRTETVAVLGESGAGKSTLAELIMTMRRPDSGSILLDAADVNAIPHEQLYATSAYLTQRTVLFEDTVAGNLRMACPAADDASLWQALDRVELGHWLRSLPAGLDTWIGESGRRLSGGEARRLALARILLRDPGFVILDEPLSGLDATTRLKLAANLAEWLADRTVLLLAHDPATLPEADHYWRLEQGCLRAL